MTNIPPGYAQLTMTFENTNYPRPCVVTLGVFNQLSVPITTIMSAWLGGMIGTDRFFDPAVARAAWSYEKAYVLYNRPGGTLESLVDDSPIAGGIGVTQPFPPQLHGIIHKRTLSAGRRFRGVMQIPLMQWPFPDALADETATLDDSVVTYLNGAADHLMAGLGSVNCFPRLFHAPSTKSPTPEPTPITLMRADSHVGTSRRRGLRIG